MTDAYLPSPSERVADQVARYEASMRLIELGVPKIFFEKPLVAAAGQAHVTEIAVLLHRHVPHTQIPRHAVAQRVRPPSLRHGRAET